MLESLVQYAIVRTIATNRSLCKTPRVSGKRHAPEGRIDPLLPVASTRSREERPIVHFKLDATT